MALYGAENLTFRGADQKSLEIFETWCWDIFWNYSRPWRSYCFLFWPCIRAACLVHRQGYVIESAGRCKPCILLIYLGESTKMWQIL